MSSLEAKLERLAGLGFQILPSGNDTHVVLEREGFVALVPRTPEGLGKAGGAGLLTRQGFAALVWRESRPFFVLKSFEQPATPDEVAALRRFASDLEEIL